MSGAIARLQALPEHEQDAIAAMILEEIETIGVGMNHSLDHPMILQSWLLLQWLSTLRVTLKNLTQIP